MLGGGAVCTLGGCTPDRITLEGVLRPAQGCIEGQDGREMGVDELLSAASDRAVTLTFGYIGCGGQVPLISRIQAAAAAILTQPALNLVLDAVDEPDRYPDIVRDVMGGEAEPATDSTRILFVRKDELWPRQSNKAVQDILHAMQVRFGPDAFLQTIKITGLFAANGVFQGVRYL